jgi:hypothetical protein
MRLGLGMMTDTGKTHDTLTPVRLFKLALVAFGGMVLSACASYQAGSSEDVPSTRLAPTQLERQINLPPDEWGRYSIGQLAMIKAILDSGEVSASHKAQRIKMIKQRPIIFRF